MFTSCNATFYFQSLPSSPTTTTNVGGKVLANSFLCAVWMMRSNKEEEVGTSALFVLL